ncbi:MAG: hypothetical protein WA982_12500 [Rubrobacteraceae bacterium]
MGYMTIYTLTVGDEGQEISDSHREEILAWLEHDENFSSELEDFHESGMNGCTKWYEHDQNMLRLSRKFPKVLFVLWGEGEEPGDLWKSYYLGGRVQEAPARVEYASFDPDELMEPGTAAG